jgi:predicted ATPase
MKGSTRRWEDQPEQMSDDVARHDALMRDIVERNGGFVFATGGDGFAIAFARAGDALACAAEAQRALAAAELPLVRMGVHTGEADERDNDYFGPTVNRAARLMAIGHGGQILVSSATERIAPDVPVRDLGEHRLRDLSEPERVFQFINPGLKSDFPPLRSLDVVPTNLPVQLTSLVGRAEEVAAVGELLATNRMVTLTGVGGVGKTRLALQSAAEALDRFRDGVWLAELAAVDAPRVVEVVTQALGVEPSGQSIEAALVVAVRDADILIVLDNCEHIVREVRRVAELLLSEAPDLCILATSREGLRVHGEQLYSVPSLEDDAAIELFVERARAVDPAFRVAADDEAAIAAVCERLDGMPLAIELAAARARMFSIPELERRVDQRFRLLRGGRGGVERHQTLRAAIDWSYDILDPIEQIALARFSVFAGGCTLDAAEAVLGADDVGTDDVLDVLSGLVDKSLVIADRSRAETRFDMYETIRQYAEEKLVETGDAEATRARHGRWAASFARAAGRGLFSPDELTWSIRLADEIDNLRAAVSWAVGAGDTDVAMRIGASFVRQATERPLLGTGHLAEEALDVTGAMQHPLRARVLAEAAWEQRRRGEQQQAIQTLRDAFEAQRQGARLSVGAYTYALTGVAWAGAFHPPTVAREGLDQAERSGNKLAETGMRIAYAVTTRLFGEEADAITHAERALAAARSLGIPTVEAEALYANGVAWCTADVDRALGYLRDSAAVSRQLGYTQGLAANLGLLSALEAMHGDVVAALDATHEQLRATTADRSALPTPFYLGPQVFNRCGRFDVTARCDGFWQSDHVAMVPLFDQFTNEARADARAALGPEEYDRVAHKGAGMTRRETHDFLLEQIEELISAR